jgi:hypothetical protein
VISNRLNRDFEPIEPRTARDLSLDHEELDCSEAPVSNHRYRLKPFIEWCAEAEVDNRNDISGRDLQTYRLCRRATSDIEPVTMRIRTGTLRCA